MAIVLTPLVEQPLADFPTLSASIAQWAHRTDLGGMLSEFVRLAESRFRRDLRLRCQITPTVLSVAAGARSVILPDDWLEFKRVSVGAAPERVLRYVPFSLLDQCPTHRLSAYSIEGDRLVLGSKSDQAQAVDAAYYAALPSLNLYQTNWLMTNHPSLYLNAALIECATYTRDTELLAVSTQRYQLEAAQLQASDQRAGHSGSVLRIQPRGIR